MRIDPQTAVCVDPSDIVLLMLFFSRGPILHGVDTAPARLVALPMSDVTGILSKIESGDPSAAEQLLPLVYDELRKLAAAKLAGEKLGQTLEATALVHEAYLRLVEGDACSWNSRGHFFGAAAEAMRRIMVENARRKSRVKHGGGLERHDLASSEIVAPQTSDDLLELDAALDRLAQNDPQSAELVKLRYFAGLTNAQAAQVVGISPRKADFMWSFARAWLRREIAGSRE
jgi:RNA polymerase sigma factor (TIGR02999 family)